MIVIRLTALFATIGIVVAGILSLIHDRALPRFDAIVADWSVHAAGQPFGLAAYFDSEAAESTSAFITVLHVGPLTFALLKLDIYYVGPLILGLAACFFYCCFLGLRRSPAFARWFNRTVTLGRISGVLAFLTVGTLLFSFCWFSKPLQWAGVRRGMTRNTVIHSMPDWVLDNSCTDQSDWVMRQRRLFGIERWWMMRVTYDETKPDRPVRTVQTVCVDPTVDNALRNPPWNPVDLH
ncbi:hypothetical protein ACXR0O_02215 [Verrucomicrobiota bacterium sgz303538]